MPKVLEYHRPASLDEAVSLLALPNAAVLAGGTRINATPFDVSQIAEAFLHELPTIFVDSRRVFDF